MIKGY